MATIGVELTRAANNTDYDAAQALLDLHSNIHITPTPFAADWRDSESTEDIEQAAKLILSCFITSDVPANNVARNTIAKTCDVSTQTNHDYNPDIELMDTTIKNLRERIKTLEAQIKTLDQSMDEASFKTAESDLNLSCENNEEDADFEVNLEYTDSNESKYSRTSGLNSSLFNDSRSRQTNRNVVYNAVLSNHNTNSFGLVPIGDGNAKVPSRLLKQINWNSYSCATRKLLTAVFSRRILASHSLTGKPSPAFPNKPAKKRLDPKLVHDIVQTVVERCRVPENVVRTSITTKCADECKMFRTREENKKKRPNKKNRENVSPMSDSESDDY